MSECAGIRLLSASSRKSGLEENVVTSSLIYGGIETNLEDLLVAVLSNCQETMKSMFHLLHLQQRFKDISVLDGFRSVII